MSQVYTEKESKSQGVSKRSPVKRVDSGKKPGSKEKTSSSDLIYGQPVIVAMRWILVASGLFLVLWNPDSLSVMRIQLLVIFLLAMANFYIHAQLLMKRPVIDEIVYFMSAVDLILVTLLIVIGSGYESRLLVYYFPAIVSFAVVFPSILTATYVGCTVGLYGVISLATGGEPMIVLSRLVIIAAIGFCGNLYLRIERSRRTDAGRSQEQLMEQIRSRQSAKQ